MIAETKFRDWPIPGFVMLIGAAPMGLGGAYGGQADVVRAGLILLALGVALVPSVIRKSRIMSVGFCALAIIGVFAALTT